jgi:hypothetical protein
MASEPLTARTDAKIRYARLHIAELRNYEARGRGLDFERAHQEAFLAQLFGAYAALLQELNEDLGSELSPNNVSLGKMNETMKVKGIGSPKTKFLYSLETNQSSWLRQAKSIRDYVTHIAGVPLVFHSGGSNHGTITMRDPNSRAELPGDYIDRFDTWVNEMENLIVHMRQKEI